MSFIGTKVPLPWDIIVFVTITTVGLGFSVKRLMIDVSDNGVPATGHAMASSTAQKGTPKLSVQQRRTASETVDLGCLERKLKKQRLQVENGIVRFKGKFCHMTRAKMKDFKGVSVLNLTTGFEGTIFFQGMGNAFVTDYMVLNNGKNDIKVEWKESSDKPSIIFLAEVFGK